MKISIGIASTTHIDAHRERMAKEALDQMAEQINYHYIPNLINHDPKQQIGVVLCGKVRQLSDGEFGLFAVFGTFENESDYFKYPIRGNNTVWQKYIGLLDNVSNVIESSRSKDVVEKDVDCDIAVLLEHHLDSTSIWIDGTVYKVKHLIARTKDLEFHIYPKDHYPAHFHVISKQKGMDARFNIETLELLSMKGGKIKNSDKKKVKNFFETHTDLWDKLKNEHERMQK